jgi:hypothetical protein
MKYETPELTALTPAISAIQKTQDKSEQNVTDSIATDRPETSNAYADWE